MSLMEDRVWNYKEGRYVTVLSSFGAFVLLVFGAMVFTFGGTILQVLFSALEGALYGLVIFASLRGALKLISLACAQFALCTSEDGTPLMRRAGNVSEALRISGGLNTALYFIIFALCTLIAYLTF